MKKWFRNRRSKNEKLDYECKKMTTTPQEVGGGFGTLQVEDINGFAAYPLQQQVEKKKNSGIINKNLKYIFYFIRKWTISVR